MELAGRSAIVTGGSLGFGKAVAARFVEAGASVLIAARGEDALRRTEAELRRAARGNGQVVEAVSADVSRPEGVAEIIARARAVLPAITVLVNNAGVLGPIGPFEEADWDEWVDTIAINLLGTALMCRAVVPLLRAEGYGKIINLSGGGATAPLARFSAYGASKAGVVRLTETLAVELQGARVDVNAIAPGLLSTRLLEQTLSAGPELVGREQFERFSHESAGGGVPLAKGAELAAFLASPASDGITGRLLSAVWDDWTSLPERREELAGSDIYTLRRIVPDDRGKRW